MTIFLLENKDGKQNKFETRAEAEEEKRELEEIGAEGLVIKQASMDGGAVDPNVSEEPLPGVDICVHCGADIEDGHCPDCDGQISDEELDSDEAVADAVNTANEIARARNEEHEQQSEQASTTVGGNDLPNAPDVTEDPVSWMPEHFIDIIEGVPSVNRKGYAVLAKHFGITVQSEPVTYPGQSDWEYAEFRATAVTPEGDTYTGYGSAHVDRGDDKGVLGELAETRACKRSIAWATGVGMVAIEEMQNSTEGRK